ncbi:MAG: NCS2 family permease [Butyricicoccus sp.]
MEKFFKVREKGSTVRTEVIGGLTTFFAMAYIIFVNPSYLSATGMDFHAVMMATTIASAIGCFLTAFLANVPFAQAPGMGLNAFFTYTVCFTMGYTWQQGLAIVFISGFLFLILTLSPLRSKLIGAIPACLKSAISAGIGLFICLIGMFNVGLITAFGDGSAGAYTAMGNLASKPVQLALIGLLITAVLLAYNVKGAIFLGIIITTIIGAIPYFGLTVYTADSFSFSVLGQTFMAMDFNLMNLGFLSLATAVISFFLVDCFDTIGTLIGTATNAGLTDKEGNLPGGDRALIADAVATCAGACLGTSTVTTFVESSTGITAGARTGLASLVTGVLFLAATFLAPIAGMIPSAATTPALIIVGVFMLKSAASNTIHWDDFEEALPCFLAIAMMPFAYSISDGIGFGFISYALIKLCRGKGKEVQPLVYLVSVLFILKYVLAIVGI